VNASAQAFEYEHEPVAGLPQELPAGERLLWQGSPLWWPLARRALRVVPVGAYFLLLALWQASSAWSASHDFQAVRHALALPLLLGAAVLLVLLAIAWFGARATVYTITDHRVVIRHGIALPMSLNVPFAQVQSAAASLRRDGSGEIALVLPKHQRVGYLVNWPHVRPGHYAQPQPTLRAIPDAARVARLLGDALLAYARNANAAAAPLPGTGVPAIVRVAAPARATHGPAASAAA